MKVCAKGMRAGSAVGRGAFLEPNTIGYLSLASRRFSAIFLFLVGVLLRGDDIGGYLRLRPQATCHARPPPREGEVPCASGAHTL